MGSSRVLSQIKPQAPLLVVPFRQCLIFMFNVSFALPGFRPRLSQEMAHISNTCNVPVALDMHIVTDS